MATDLSEAEMQTHVDKLLSPEPGWKAWGGETEGEALAHFFDRSQHECAPDPEPEPAPERPDIPYLVARLVDGLETGLTVDEYTRLPADVRTRTRRLRPVDLNTGLSIYAFSPDNEKLYDEKHGYCAGYWTGPQRAFKHEIRAAWVDVDKMKEIASQMASLRKEFEGRRW